jgi:hypothetical protein
MAASGLRLFDGAAAVVVTQPFCDVPVEEQFSPRRLNV